MKVWKGGCACGAIRYEARGRLVGSGACYCRSCQYASGGGPVYAMLLARGDIRFLKGVPRIYRSAAEAGDEVARYFCGDCGTAIAAESAARPGYLSVRVGSLDDPAAFRPTMNMWVRSAQPWHSVDPALRSVEANAW